MGLFKVVFYNATSSCSVCAQVWRRRHGIGEMLRAPQLPRGFQAIKRCMPHALLGRSLEDEGPVLLLQLRGFGAGMQEV